MSDVAVSACASAPLPRRLQHSGDRGAVAHHAWVRQETGFTLPATGAGALREGSEMRTGLETREELFAVMEQIAEERECARPIVRELVARGRSIDDIEIPEG